MVSLDLCRKLMAALAQLSMTSCRQKASFSDREYCKPATRDASCFASLARYPFLANFFACWLFFKQGKGPRLISYEDDHTSTYPARTIIPVQQVVLAAGCFRNARNVMRGCFTLWFMVWPRGPCGL